MCVVFDQKTKYETIRSMSAFGATISNKNSYNLKNIPTKHFEVEHQKINLTLCDASLTISISSSFFHYLRP